MAFRAVRSVNLLEWNAALGPMRSFILLEWNAAFGPMRSFILSSTEPADKLRDVGCGGNMVRSRRGERCLRHTIYD